MSHILKNLREHLLGVLRREVIETYFVANNRLHTLIIEYFEEFAAICAALDKYHHAGIAQHAALNLVLNRSDVCIVVALEACTEQVEHYCVVGKRLTLPNINSCATSRIIGKGNCHTTQFALGVGCVCLEGDNLEFSLCIAGCGDC